MKSSDAYLFCGSKQHNLRLLPPDTCFLPRTSPQTAVQHTVLVSRTAQYDFQTVLQRTSWFVLGFEELQSK
jgi:hypothetical protein